MRGAWAGLVLMSLWAAGASAAGSNPPTIKDLEAQQVDVDTSPPKGVDATKTMDSYRRFLDLNAGDAGLRSPPTRGCRPPRPSICTRRC
jgi:hypothetical protein